MMDKHWLNKNVIYLSSGEHLQVKHFIGGAIMLLFFTALYVGIVE